MGLDCSGWIRCIFIKVVGIDIGFGTWGQLQTCRRDGQAVDIDALQAADIVFWDDDPTTTVPGHVGMATGDGTILECSGRYNGVTETPLAEWRPHVHSCWRLPL